MNSWVLCIVCFVVALVVTVAWGTYESVSLMAVMFNKSRRTILWEFWHKRGRTKDV